MSKPLALASSVILLLETCSLAASSQDTAMNGRGFMREVGVLTCRFEPGIGAALGSVRGADCTFRPFRHSQSERYVGDLSRIGLDLGYIGPQTISWKISSPEGRIYPGLLEGQYIGSSADAVLGLGAGTHVLVNDDGERINLEVATKSAQEGLAIALGIATLKLRLAESHQQ